MRSHWYRTVGILLFSTMIIACGGRQKGGSGNGDCNSVSAENSTAEWDAWASCKRSAEGAPKTETCVKTLRLATSATPNALAAASTCILQGTTRSELSYISDGLHAIASDSDKVAAIAGSWPGRFHDSTDGNILAGTLTSRAQRGLGKALNNMDVATRELLFDFALKHNLAQLIAGFDEQGFSDEFRAETDGALISSFAEGIRADHPLSETERWALTRSGTWSADEIIRCQNQNQTGCEQWKGKAPLTLLDNSKNRGDDPRTPGMIQSSLTHSATSAEEVQAGLRWLSASDSDALKRHLRSLIYDMVMESNDKEFRTAIATGATGEICAPDLVVPTGPRTYHNEDQSADNVWNTFLSRCLDQYWNWRELVYISTAGSALNAHIDVLKAILKQHEELIADASCSVIEAVANASYNDARTLKVPMTGLAYGVAADARPDCVEQLSDELSTVARNEAEHPEGRYKAIKVLAESGDKTQCSQIQSADKWTPRPNAPGMTSHAESLREEAIAACQ